MLTCDHEMRYTETMRFLPSRNYDIAKIRQLLGNEADNLLNHRSEKIQARHLHLPGPDFVNRVWSISDRSDAVLANLRTLFDTGRLAGTGYMAVLPVDQGIEHFAGSDFVPNPMYFDPENIVRLAVEGGCNAVASTFGVLGAVSKKYADQIPFIVKINHNELISYPNAHDQVLFGTVEQAFHMGAVAVGATIYFGSEQTRRQITEISAAFARAHELGMATILWCYVRNKGFTVDGVNYESAADLTAQANHLGATIQADIVKQKLPDRAIALPALNVSGRSYGTFDARTEDLIGSHVIDQTRFQVANGYMGRVGLISAGGKSGKDDLAEAVRASVINKRAGGMGMIVGRKAFQRPFDEGVELLHAIQDVYLSSEVTIA